MAKKKFFWGTLIILIFSVIVIIKLKGNKTITVEVANVGYTSIEELIPASGKIQPVTEVKISPDVSGEIIELNFQEGDVVQKGDLIIRIKQDIYISAVERAEASLSAVRAQYSQQKAQLKQIELNYKRNKLLHEQKVISDADYENSLSQYEVALEQLKAAEYNIKSSEASVKEAKESLTKTNIYAPMSGTISALNVEIGERVVGTSQMAGTEMLRIADLKKMEVVVDVNENDIIRVSQNDTSIIEIDAYPNREFKGVVTHIANSSKVSNSGATNFEVKINIIPESYQDLYTKNNIPLRPGMSASLSIITEKKERALSVPISAIAVKEGSTNKFVQKVWVYNSESSTVESKEITTGLQDLSNIEILSGITDDCQIVVAPYNAINKDLRDNAKVRIKDKRR